MYLKNEKGVTLIALTITIIVMLIVSGVIIRSSNTHINTQKRDKLYSDIDNLNNKINKYYIDYRDVPVLSKKYCSKDELVELLNSNVSSHNVELNNSTEGNNTIINPNDDDSYYIIDLEKLSGLTLNYGYDSDYSNAKQSEDNISTNIQDIYIINKTTHQIYYPKGIYTEDYMYYCYNLNTEEIQTSNLTKWKYKKNDDKRIIVTNGIIDLRIGTYINYNPAVADAKGETTFEKKITSDGGSPTYVPGYYVANEKPITEGNGYGDQEYSNKADVGGWRVLGADEKTGELLIISGGTAKTTEKANFYLGGIVGFTYGESELNKVCSIFGLGYGATGARSVNIDDVNRVTGYNPNNVGEYDPEQKGMGKKFTEGDLSEYGNKTTYSWTTTANQISYIGSNKLSGTGTSPYYTSYKKGFNWYDIERKTWQNSQQDTTAPVEITTLTNTAYFYYPDSLQVSSETGNGLDKESEEYKTIFKYKTGGALDYWLASRCVETWTNNAKFAMMTVASTEIVTSTNLYITFGQLLDNDYGIRPVVSLKSDIQLEKQEDESYNIIK